MYLALRFIIILVLLGCDLPESPQKEASNLTILYVGNSLTYTNDLPSLVREIGKMENLEIKGDEYLFPNYSLEDHWNEGKVQGALKRNKYDLMVAQQGPSALQESQVLLKEFAQRFSDECRKNNTKVNLYMVWPSKARSFDLDNVIYSYKQAAKQIDATLSPAGLAWKKAWQKDPSLNLYGLDEFHPNTRGSVLAAMVIYATIRNKQDLSFINLANTSWKREMTVEEFEVLKQAALDAVKDN